MIGFGFFKVSKAKHKISFRIVVTTRPLGPTTPTSNAHHTNPRQGVCMNCRETRHSSTDCPLRYGNVQHCGTNEHNGEAFVSCSSCGTPCVLRTANTVNNRGRKFYSCQSQECNFSVSCAYGLLIFCTKYTHGIFLAT
ncbi:hypothetical protein GYH30_010630 [Glycine max]|uniref:GRF-type domain-containing protein n=1 Tax=Glycine max TaxID=3847 RepID=A0A0R0KAU5_SOYBN|nr:hypothetical protein GYH30_010630 [Glycine max]